MKASDVSLQDLSGYTGKEAVSEYAQNAVAWAAQQGMLHGTDLHPTVAATRAEAAQMFSLMNERTVQESSVIKAVYDKIKDRQSVFDITVIDQALCLFLQNKK